MKVRKRHRTGTHWHVTSARCLYYIEHSSRRVANFNCSTLTHAASVNVNIIIQTASNLYRNILVVMVIVSAASGMIGTTMGFD